ncbi:MAG: membrane protein insertion efficiency factor YidD [Planctomycetota bacterium]
MHTILILPLRFFRRWIRPLFGGQKCRFVPSCSAFAEEALQVHGSVKGTLLTVWRLLRCQPLCRGGFDPVPPKGRWRP